MPRKHKIKHNSAPKSIPLRVRALALIGGGILALILFIIAVRPKTQLMSAAEIATVQRRGMLRAGVLSDMPGFSDAEQGLEVDLARQLAQVIFPEGDLSLCLELVPVTSRTARPKLNSGDIDIAFAQLQDTGESQYTCSLPYYRDPVWLYCSAQHTAQALKDQTIGVVQETPEAGLIATYNKENDVQLQSQSYGSYPDLLDALQKGEVLFIALPGAKARALGVEGQPKHSSALGSLGYVAVCSSEESALSQLADVIIGELQQNGTLAQWVNRYQLG